MYNAGFAVFSVFSVMLSLIGGVTVLGLFAWVEARVAEPMFRLSLFRIRAFTAGNVTSLLSGMGRGGLMFILIIWLQGIRLPRHGYSFASAPLWAGIFMLPLTVGFLIAGPISGWLSDHFGARPFATGGMVVAAGSFVLLTLLPANLTYWVFAAILLLNGIGTGLFASPNRAGIMNSLPGSQHGSGSPFPVVVLSARLFEPRGVAGPPAYDLGFAAGEVDDRGWLGAAVTRVDHGIHHVVEPFFDLPALCHRLVIVGQEQCAGEQRLTEVGEQGLSNDMVRNPDTDRLLFRVQQQARYLLRRREDEGVAAGRCCLDRAKHVVVDAHKLTQLREVLAYKGEVVTIVEMPDRPDPADAVTIAQLASQCETRVRRVRDECTGADAVSHIADNALLRILGVHLKVLRHPSTLRDQDARAQAAQDGAGPRPEPAAPIEGGVAVVLRPAQAHWVSSLCPTCYAGSNTLRL